jgi:acetoin utilization deacetylase AcuC-like enzyme
MLELAPRPARVVVFLEGGYDLGAMRDGTASTITALVGEDVEPVEPRTSGGPGREVVDAAADLWREVAGLPS